MASAAASAKRPRSAYATPTVSAVKASRRRYTTTGDGPRCADASAWMADRTSSATAVPRDEVQEREQEDPHDVDEMPIEAHDLDARRVVGGDGAAVRPPHDGEHETEADHHVERVK